MPTDCNVFYFTKQQNIDLTHQWKLHGQSSLLCNDSPIFNDPWSPKVTYHNESQIRVEKLLLWEDHPEYEAYLRGEEHVVRLPTYSRVLPVGMLQMHNPGCGIIFQTLSGIGDPKRSDMKEGDRWEFAGPIWGRHNGRWQRANAPPGWGSSSVEIGPHPEHRSLSRRNGGWGTDTEFETDEEAQV